MVTTATQHPSSCWRSARRHAIAFVGSVSPKITTGELHREVQVAMASASLHRPVFRLLQPLDNAVALRQCRSFIATPTKYRPQHRKESFNSRLGPALKRTKLEWYWIPATAGIAFLGGVQFYRVYTRQQARREEEEHEEWEEHEPGKKPKRRKRTKPSGPWYLNFRLI